MISEKLRTLRDGCDKMPADPGFAADAKRLVNWDGSYLSGEQMQKKIDRTVTQPLKVINLIKEILQ